MLEPQIDLCLHVECKQNISCVFTGKSVKFSKLVRVSVASKRVFENQNYGFNVYEC